MRSLVLQELKVFGKYSRSRKAEEGTRKARFCTTSWLKVHIFKPLTAAFVLFPHHGTDLEPSAQETSLTT